MPGFVWADKQYRTACVRLISSFEQDLESTGLIRGSPDFVFTVLTYAAVSLLRALQTQFAHLEPDRDGILATARRAADTLARCAMTSDHLPASQSVFLSRLIDVKSHKSNLKFKMYLVHDNSCNPNDSKIG